MGNIRIKNQHFMMNNKEDLNQEYQFKKKIWLKSRKDVNIY